MQLSVRTTTPVDDLSPDIVSTEPTSGHYQTADIRNLWCEREEKFFEIGKIRRWSDLMPTFTIAPTEQCPFLGTTPLGKILGLR